MIDPTTPQDSWDDEHRLALRQMVSTFVQREILPHVTEWEEAGQLPRELHQAAAKVGILAAGYPEELGGLGTTLDLSESRVSQMHSSIVARLKDQLHRRRPEFG